MNVGRDSQMNSLPARGLCACDAAAAERRTEVDQVMADDLRRPSRSTSVSSVLMLRESSWFSQAAEDAQPAQLAAVLVREDVVRIVRPRAVVAERPDRLARERLARQRRGRCRRRCARRASSIASTSRCPSGAARPSSSSTSRPLADHERLAAERREVVLRNVVAEGMEELRRDDLGAAGHLRVRRRIELDEVDLRRWRRGS